jgi:hypothetical protein
MKMKEEFEKAHDTAARIAQALADAAGEAGYRDFDPDEDDGPESRIIRLTAGMLLLHYKPSDRYEGDPVHRALTDALRAALIVLSKSPPDTIRQIRELFAANVLEDAQPKGALKKSRRRE